MDILCYIDSDDKGRLAAMMPNAALAPDDGFPAEKPRLAVVQLSTEVRGMLALQLVRKRVPVALLNAAPPSYLAGLSACAQRNHVPAILLESWRFIPAVSSVKEICDSGCLVGGRACRLVFHPENELEKLRAQDIADWFGCASCQIATDAPEGAEVHLTITADNGTIETSFSLDGQQARFKVSLSGHTHERMIPKANPLLSELAILSLSAKGSGKIRSLPLLMKL
ncbi:MAG: hypothetical protein IKR81_11015 [Victivallales bacterium]|nr:hypothetical protein [Victivallales bacterium]